MDADGNLTYQVKGNTTAGQVAAITVTATMQNYEDATYTLTINAIDKTVVSEKSGSEVAISGSNALTYGQSLSDTVRWRDEYGRKLCMDEGESEVKRV